MKCQRETDGRKLSSKEKESLRLRVVRRIEAGIHPEDLARDLDINRRTVYRWLEKYHYGGEDALKTEPRPGREPKLNALQMSQLARMIRDRNPLQLSVKRRPSSSAVRTCRSFPFDFFRATRGAAQPSVRARQ